jgi:hypothetical protein
MRSNEWKARLRVIKLRHVAPLFGGVTSRAAEGLSRFIERDHALIEFSLVNVLMACHTAEMVEMIERYL